MELTLDIPSKQIFGLVEQLPNKEKHKLKAILDSQLVDNKPFAFTNIEILKIIEESKYIFSLKESWDEEGALPISDLTWEEATFFLKNYSQFIFENEAIAIQAPEINPCRDGSIDLSWRTSKARMLINIKNVENGLAHYYGDHYNNINSIKGFVKTDEIQEFLATWMKALA